MDGRRASGRGRSGGIALLVLLACLAGVRPVWRAVADHRDGTPTRQAPSADVGNDDHFPGAALAYAAGSAPARSELAAPAPGSTGTVTPPPEPMGAASPIEPVSTIVAARPFRLGRAAALDRGRALECLTAAVYHEAGNQGDDGERAVAQVVLNRVRHPAFPASVCGVVYEGSEQAGCQFSFACDGSTERASARDGWTRAMRIASDALAGQVFAPVGLATHYHTYAVTPAWNRALVMTDVVGAHFFHRWKGYWGTPAAFSQPWSGHEPVPGPHARRPDPAIPGPPPAVAPIPPATIQAPAAPAAPPATRLPSSPVLDRWKDSGTPLR